MRGERGKGGEGGVGPTLRAHFVAFHVFSMCFPAPPLAAHTGAGRQSAAASRREVGRCRTGACASPARVSPACASSACVCGRARDGLPYPLTWYTPGTTCGCAHACTCTHLVSCNGAGERVGGRGKVQAGGQARARALSSGVRDPALFLCACAYIPVCLC